MKYHSAAAMILLCLFAGARVQAQETAPDEIVKIETTLVSVPVVVSDRQGRYVPNLKAIDFTLYQDGTKQDFELFAAEEEQLNVAIVLDTSPSTAAVIDEIKRAALKFTKLLQPEDREMVVTFDTSIQFLSPMTSNRAELERAIRSAEVGPYIGTIMRDAVRDVVERGFDNTNGRKAIVLLTDGQDFGSRFGGEDLLDLLQESDVMLYSVYYKTEQPNPGRMGRNGDPRRGPERAGGRFPGGIGRPDRGKRRARIEDRQKKAVEYLEQMSELTAGRFYKKDVTDLTKTFGLIVDELKKQYRIGFYPIDESVDGQIHSLKVKVAQDNVSVRSRNSYRTAK